MDLKSCGSFLDFIYLFIFKERGREGEERERNMTLTRPQRGDLACNPGMCPDQESNRHPFGLQNDEQSTEPHQAELKSVLK